MSDLLDFLPDDDPPKAGDAEEHAPAAEACPIANRNRMVLISEDDSLATMLQELWPAEAMHVQVMHSAAQALEQLYADPPDILVVDEHLPDMPGLEVVSAVKSENVYRQMPVVLVLSAPERAEGVNWSFIEADDFLLRPSSPFEIKARLTLTLCRAHRTLDANPLSKLPGNTTILQRVQDLIDAKADFGLAYVDLDNFKSFNDKYGFSRGDEALMMTARLIVNIVREQHLDGTANMAMNFVGHVGGDDYVFILPAPIVEQACKMVCQRFDAIVPSFYDDEDRLRGGIHSTDRQGIFQDFPLMSLSIAVVINHNGKLQHAGEAATMAAALKKKAKALPGSSYVLDQRQN